MRKTILVGAALLASAAPATAHNAGLAIDCDRASITYSYFPTYMDSTVTWTVTLDGEMHTTGSRTVRRSGTITVPLAITGTREMSFNVSWDSDIDGGRTIRDTLECPAPPPPVTPPPVVPPTPKPPPVITTPAVPTPPANPPTPVKPPKPKPKNCAQLKAAGAGIKWLRKRGCVKTTAVKVCPPGQRRASLRVEGQVYTRCVPRVPVVAG